MNYGATERGVILAKRGHQQVLNGEAQAKAYEAIARSNNTVNQEYRCLSPIFLPQETHKLTHSTQTMSTAGGASIPPEQLKARYLGTGVYHIVKYLLEMGLIGLQISTAIH
eukprot:scaffold75_cov239-Chaetoceros_neogracile.AAC.12